MTKHQFIKICQNVCDKIKPSGSLRLDQEAIYYGICWQVCDSLELSLPLDQAVDSRLLFFQQLMQMIINDTSAPSFDAVQIAASFATASLLDKYGDAKTSNILNDVC